MLIVAMLSVTFCISMLSIITLCTTVVPFTLYGSLLAIIVTTVNGLYYLPLVSMLSSNFSSSSLKLRLKKLVCLPLASILNNKKNFLLFAIIQVELARVFVRGNHFEPSPTLANAGAYQNGALLKGLGF